MTGPQPTNDRRTCDHSRAHYDINFNRKPDDMYRWVCPSCGFQGPWGDAIHARNRFLDDVPPREPAPEEE